MALRIKDIIAGNTRALNLTFRNVGGGPHDLTGAIVSFTAKNASKAIAIALNSVSDSGQFTLVSAANGQIRIVLSSANTNQPPGTYSFGAQAVLADGSVLEDTGKFKIKEQYVS